MVASHAWSPTSSKADGQPKSSAATRRAYFVDILRLIASFQMVNGHTLDAVLLDSARGGSLWGDYLWFRGMVSVSFMFVAGFAFHLATLARFEKHRARPEEIKRRFRRGVDLIIIGYLLRVPYDYLLRPGEIPDTLIDQLLRCNVLQCIGVTLIVLELITVLAKRPRQVAVAATVLAAAIVFTAPLTDRIDPHGPFHIVLSYVSHQAGSMFPVIPWATFMLAGAAIGFWAMPDAAKTQWPLTLSRLLIVALALWVVGKLIAAAGISGAGSGVHPNSQPRFIVERLMAVTLVTAGLCVVSFRIKRFPKLLRTLSGETLFLYVFHLVVIFSLPFGVSRTIGRTLALPQALVVSCVMLAVTAAAGVAWSRSKSWREQRRRSMNQMEGLS
ncbi:MAG: heparan-alpha-glucosaminide N-acetyltransferase domain-containing protein [Myxococcota bacterium]